MLRHVCQYIFELVSVVEDFLSSLCESHHLLRNLYLRIVKNRFVVVDAPQELAVCHGNLLLPWINHHVSVTKSLLSPEDDYLRLI